MELGSDIMKQYVILYSILAIQTLLEKSRELPFKKSGAITAQLYVTVLKALRLNKDAL